VENPFEESYRSDVADEVLVRQAKSGDQNALHELVCRHQAWIYNVAVRMIWEPADAEDVTQEVLLKAFTNLESFQGRSTFRTWLYRIAVNHMLNMKYRGKESPEMSFASYGEALDRAPNLDLPDPKTVPVDLPLLVEEAKIGCTMGMLLCLDRRQRLIYTLGEILQASDSIGAELLDMTPDNFRQCLSRARRDLYNFMNDKCGLVNSDNPCRCAKKTRAFIQAGYVDPHRLRFAAGHVNRMRHVAAGAIASLEGLLDNEYRAIYRDHPFLNVDQQAHLLQRVVNHAGFRAALNLDEKNP
jgi:RNA polymerase sigma factor (sigma-70 family)